MRLTLAIVWVATALILDLLVIVRSVEPAPILDRAPIVRTVVTRTRDKLVIAC
jgi:hypothetical protein